MDNNERAAAIGAGQFEKKDNGIRVSREILNIGGIVLGGLVVAFPLSQVDINIPIITPTMEQIGLGGFLAASYGFGGFAWRLSRTDDDELSVLIDTLVFASAGFATASLFGFGGLVGDDLQQIIIESGQLSPIISFIVTGGLIWSAKRLADPLSFLGGWLSRFIKPAYSPAFSDIEMPKEAEVVTAKSSLVFDVLKDCKISTDDYQLIDEKNKEGKDIYYLKFSNAELASSFLSKKTNAVLQSGFGSVVAAKIVGANEVEMTVFK